MNAVNSHFVFISFSVRSKDIYLSSMRFPPFLYKHHVTVSNFGHLHLSFLLSDQ